MTARHVTITVPVGDRDITAAHEMLAALEAEAHCVRHATTEHLAVAVARTDRALADVRRQLAHHQLVLRAVLTAVDGPAAADRLDRLIKQRNDLPTRTPRRVPT